MEFPRTLIHLRGECGQGPAGKENSKFASTYFDYHTEPQSPMVPMRGHLKRSHWS